MKEAQIKERLRRFLTADNLLCVEELAICGHVARADVVVISDGLAGYEVKSEYDSLSRLKDQCAAYDQVFEYSTLVVAAVHLNEARTIVPKRWGIIKIPPKSENFLQVRKAKRNKGICGSAIAEFFWQKELVEILIGSEASNPRKSWNRKRLREEVIGVFSPQELIGYAANKMRFRPRWRAA